MVLALATAAWAISTRTDNDGGRAYGASGSARSTDYPAWDDLTYIDTYYLKNLNINFKVKSIAAETLIVNILGTNYNPDSLKSYSLVYACTLKSTETASTAWKQAAALRADSAILISLPFGTGILTGTLPRYVKTQFIIADSAGTVSTATISDSWMGR